MIGDAERLRIDADLDLGVASRVLDMLGAIDRYPVAMRLCRDVCRVTLDVELERVGPAVTTRLRQIPGVRRVSAIEVAT